MRELACVAIIAGCGAPSVPSRPVQESACRLQPIEDLAAGPVTETRLRCALPSGMVLADGTVFSVILPNKQPVHWQLGPGHPGLALETGGDLGRTFAVYSPEMPTRLGVRVGSTLADVRRIAPKLDCVAMPSTTSLSCSPPLEDPGAAAGFVFYLRGAITFTDDESLVVTDLDRHAAATVAYFHYSAPLRP